MMVMEIWHVEQKNWLPVAKSSCTGTTRRTRAEEADGSLQLRDLCVVG